MTIRAAIIGCGNIAGGYDEQKKDAGCYTHAGAYRQRPEIKLVAAADPDPKRRAAFGAYWGVPHLYPDARRLLEEQRVELVSICAPDAAHEEALRHVLAVSRPRVIFAEKPLALGREAARSILDEAQRLGVRIVLNNQRRWDEGHRRVRALLAEGGIGQIVSATAFYVKGLYHIGCTVSNTIRFLLGEVEAVQALGGAHQATAPCDPSVDAVLYLRNGAIATMLGADRYGYRYSLFELDILGTTGRVRVAENGDRILVSRVQDYPHYPGFAELREQPGETIATAMGSAIPTGVQQISEFLTGQRQTLESDGEEGYRDLCVLDAIAASKAQGGLRLPVVP